MHVWILPINVCVNAHCLCVECGVPGSSCLSTDLSLWWILREVVRSAVVPSVDRMVFVCPLRLPVHPDGDLRLREGGPPLLESVLSLQESRQIPPTSGRSCGGHPGTSCLPLRDIPRMQIHGIFCVEMENTHGKEMNGMRKVGQELTVKDTGRMEDFTLENSFPQRRRLSAGLVSPGVGRVINKVKAQNSKTIKQLTACS
jgi:hypothetical protein